MEETYWILSRTVLICGIFWLGGLVKGVTGMGLPTVSIILLAATLGLKQGIALIFIPTLLTNIWQGMVGGAGLAIWKRLWPVFLSGMLTAFLMAGVLVKSSGAWLGALLGTLLCVYASLRLANIHFASPGRWERLASFLVGTMSGGLAGLTGVSIFPSAPYFQSLGLGKNVLVQALGIWSFVVYLTLLLALQRHALLSLDVVKASLLGTFAALVGLAIGRRLRDSIPEAAFQRVFFMALFAAGCGLVVRTFL